MFLCQKCSMPKLKIKFWTESNQYNIIHSFLNCKMPKSNSFTWNQIHSKLSFRSLNSCVGCTGRYLESLCIQFKVMDQRLHWWLKEKIEWRLNFTGDWQNKTAKYLRPISYRWIFVLEKFGCLDLNDFHLKWIIGNHGSWKNQNPGSRFGATS